MHIINAKFSPTTYEKTFIQRLELLKEMDKNKKKKVMLVTAPAGYGKTTLLSQFSHTTDEKVIWYHLDALDNEIVTFMTYLTEGIARCFGKHHKDIISISTDKLNQGDIKGQVAELLNYLSQNCENPLCIVIDDYHYITKACINEWLSIFIKYMPSNIRIIIASRVYPTINLDYLLASDQLLEIDINRLKFSKDEERSFIEKAKPNDQEIYNKELIKKNNGWPFGLNLLKHAMSDNVVGDYEIQELYKKCFDNIFDQFEDQEFLLTTCLLEILDIEACNYITSRTNSDETLKRMYRKGLFISKTQSGGFKYHDLFREFLIEKVINKTDIYKKIADYYTSKGNFLDAIEYLLLSEDYDRANDLLKQEQYKYISIAYYIKIYHWEKQIPQKIALKYGSFSLIKALIALKNFDIEGGTCYIQNAGSYFIQKKDEEGILKTDIIWVKVLRMQQKFEEAYTLANAIYKKIYERPLDEKMDILNEKLHIASYLCKVNEEFIVLKNESAGIDESQIKPHEIQVLALFEYAAYLIGEYRTAMILQAKYRNRISPLNSIVYTIRIYMVWGHLEEGKSHILREIDNAKRFGINASLPELYGILAELEFHMGNFGYAEKYFREAIHLFEDKNNNLFHLCIFTYVNMLAFLGRKDEALNMINNYYPKIPKDNYLAFMMTDMMLCQTYLILKDYERAIEFAEKCMKPSKAFGTKLYIATLTSVMAAAYLELEDEDRAIAYAKTAMELSEHGYYIQDFITYYEFYKRLCQFCIKKGIKKAFIEEISNIISERTPGQIVLQDSNKLYVRFFGDNIVNVGSRLIRWRTVKARNVFYYMLYHNQTGVTKDKLIDTFFESYDLDKASANLRTTLTYIRKVFLEEGYENIIWQSNSRYFINDKDITTDLMTFKKIISQLEEKKNDDDIQLIEVLCDTYNGHFCEDIDLYEFSFEKEKYYNIFEKALLEAIVNLKRDRRYKEGIELLNVLIKHQKYNEAYYTLKADMYNMLGDSMMVKRTYEELKLIRDAY